MRRFFLVTLLSISLFSCKTLDEKTVGQVASVLLNSGNTTSGTPTDLEVSSALKESLASGVITAVSGLSSKDGFLGNQALKILFPPEAKAVESKLRSIGMGSLCDSFITSLNRAAENASSKAKPIFINSVKNMSFSDATKILLGPDGSATNYLMDSTSAEIKQAYLPVISSSLDKVDATKSWAKITSIYNKIPLVKKVNPNLQDYVTDKSMSAMFGEIKVQENMIRKSPADRTSAILKKVFSYADSKK